MLSVRIGAELVLVMWFVRRKGFEFVPSEMQPRPVRLVPFVLLRAQHRHRGAGRQFVCP